MTVPVRTRAHSIRCPKCFDMQSRLSYSPLHCMKIEIWKFGWVFYESFKRYPQVLTSSEIQRRLSISSKAALNLKRRHQLFCAQQQDKIKKLFYQELEQRYTGFNFPPDRDTDLMEILKNGISDNKLKKTARSNSDAGSAWPDEKDTDNKQAENHCKQGIQSTSINSTEETRPVNIDTMALFSASQRANKGRKRHKHSGMTASIYMSDKLGGKQVGSLYQTITWKEGPIIITSVPTNRIEHLKPVIDACVPPRTPVFSDEGYKWLSWVNHRTINHSAKSPDKKYRWARNRWSKNGINSQVAEGSQSSYKCAMKQYRYFRPAYSQLYADEFSFMRNVSYFGIDKIIGSSSEPAQESLNNRSRPEAAGVKITPSKCLIIFSLFYSQPA